MARKAWSRMLAGARHRFRAPGSFSIAAYSDEEDYLDVLGDLVRTYETEHRGRRGVGPLHGPVG